MERYLCSPSIILILFPSKMSFSLVFQRLVAIRWCEFGSSGWHRSMDLGQGDSSVKWEALYLTPKCSEEFFGKSYFRKNLDWWNITIWPDYIYIYVLYVSWDANNNSPTLISFFFWGGHGIFRGMTILCSTWPRYRLLRIGGPSMANCLRVPPWGPKAKVWQVKVVKGKKKVYFGGRSMEFQECDDMILSIWLHDVYVNVYFFAGIFSQSSSVDCISISKESSIMRFMMSHDFFNQIHERRFHSWQAHRNNISWQNRALKTVSPRGLFFLDDCWCSHVIHHNIHNEDVPESIWMIF